VTVQLILEVPSGADVFTTGGVGEASGSQYTTVATLEPGQQENMRIHVDLHRPGEYERSSEKQSISSEMIVRLGRVLKRQSLLNSDHSHHPLSNGLAVSGSSVLTIVPTTYSWLTNGLESRVNVEGLLTALNHSPVSLFLQCTLSEASRWLRNFAALIICDCPPGNPADDIVESLAGNYNDNIRHRYGSLSIRCDDCIRGQRSQFLICPTIFSPSCSQ